MVAKYVYQYKRYSSAILISGLSICINIFNAGSVSKSLTHLNNVHVLEIAHESLVSGIAGSSTFIKNCNAIFTIFRNGAVL